VYHFLGTNSLSRAKLNYENGLVKNIHYGDIHTKFSSLFKVNSEEVPYVNKEIDLRRIPKESYCDEGDLVIVDASEDYEAIGKSIEIVQLNNERVLAGLHTFLARPEKSKVELGFSGYLMQGPYVKAQIKKIAQGTKVLGLSSSRLGKVEIDLPVKDEQHKIVRFLTALDAKIEARKNQIDKTHAFKNGLLQQMFV
jgi:type I restriction enzyme S subunit